MTVTTTIRGAGLAALILAASLAGQAQAGTCPADKMGKDAMAPGPDMPSGVTDTVIGSIDLGKQAREFAGRMFRMRKLVIQPGGVVPWHSHAERPANIYVVEGTINEYRSTCAVPIEHKQGDTFSEFGELSHWWKNNSSKPVTLISADILPPQMKDDHPM